MTRDNLEGAGPWLFETDKALSQGDSFVIDFRNMEQNGQKGYFKKYLPLDQAVITNTDASAFLSVEYNGVFEQSVGPSTSETFDDAGVRSIRVTNRTSGTTIPAGDVMVEVLKTPYGADDAARDRRGRGPIGDVIEKFTGVGL